MVNIKPAEEKDFEFWYSLKCEDDNIFWAGLGEEKPDREKLKVFFDKTVSLAGEPGERKLFIVYDEAEPIGEISIKPNGDKCGIPFSISESKRGNHRAEDAFMLGLQKAKELGFKRFDGRVREDNLASFFCLAICGVKKSGEYDTEFVPNLNKEIKVYHVYKDL